MPIDSRTRAGSRTHIEAVDARRAAGRLEEGAEHLDRRALARAVRAEEAEDFPVPHLEGEVIDGGERAELPDEVAHFNRGRIASR